jgi:hypothetical protein
VIEVRLAGEALDATGTTIDGNGNRLSEGNGVDDFVWTIQTLPTTTPQIQQITPTSGTIGRSVVLIGVGFTGATEVLFNGVPAQFIAVRNQEETAIRAYVPVGAITGPVTVINPLGPGTVRWPTSAATAVLESTDHPGGGQWQTVTANPVLEDGYYSVTVPAGDGVRFFRLKYQPSGESDFEQPRGLQQRAGRNRIRRDGCRALGLPPRGCRVT